VEPVPGTTEIRPQNPPNLSKLLELAENEPKSLFAAYAYFSVATLLKRSASEGSDERATMEAEQLFERVIADYGQVQSGGTNLADLAKPELTELRRVGVGNVAQEIEGESLEGKKMKLSDYRGKVVVLTFWATWCPPCMEMVPDERKLVERMTGKEFAMIGVNADTERSKVIAVVEKERINWPSFQDGGRTGPIATAWSVRGWPTIYVLDRKGVIRYRNVRGRALAAAVDALIHEGK
jgi:peroxiredoxin